MTCMKPKNLLVAIVISLIVIACGGSSVTPPEATATSEEATLVVTKESVEPTSESLSAGEATPVATRKRGGVGVLGTGEPTPEPLPDRIGDCEIRKKAQCPGADLRDADLGVITRAGHHVARFAANMNGANLRGANLEGANLVQVKFEGADFRDANLRYAHMVGAYLYQADLRGADLTGATLAYSDMEEALLEGAIFCRTLMADGIERNDDCP